MPQRKILILLAFSLCLNAGFLITALTGHIPFTERGQKSHFKAYSRHLDLLNGLELSEATFKQAKDLLDTFIQERSVLAVKKMNQKLETLAMLEKNPLLPRDVMETREREKARIEEAMAALGIDYSLAMREILPPEKMALFYANAGRLVAAHRDKMILWMKTAD